MSNPKGQVGQKSDRSKQQEASKNNSASNFSDDEVRTRAYEIYESRGSVHNRADEDWSQAQTELRELVGGK